jgi:hypothetical protein
MDCVSAGVSDYRIEPPFVGPRGSRVKGHNNLGFRLISGLLMTLCFLIGAGLLWSFLANTMMPSAMAPRASISTNYWGLYMMGFAGAVLFAWGACLFTAVFRPALARGIGTATAFGLVINAIFRLIAWFSGEFAEVGNLPRVEAAIMLLLALGFIWLRPETVPTPETAQSGERRAA